MIRLSLGRLIEMMSCGTIRVTPDHLQAFMALLPDYGPVAFQGKEVTWPANLSLPSHVLESEARAPAMNRGFSFMEAENILKRLMSWDSIDDVSERHGRTCGLTW